MEIRQRKCCYGYLAHNMCVCVCVCVSTVTFWSDFYWTEVIRVDVLDEKEIGEGGMEKKETRTKLC